MKAFITGGNGFLGKHVCAEFKNADYEIVSPRSSALNLMSQEMTTNAIKTEKPDVVVHLAAKVGGIGANMENPGSFFYENMAMGINVIEACRLANVSKLIVAGTICAYPKFATVPFKESEIWNGYPEETNAPYGIAKKALMVMCQAYRKQYGSNFIYLLPVNLYGPHDNFDLNSSHVIPAMIHKLLNAKENGQNSVVLWGDGSPTREFLYVKDCAAAFLKAAELYDKADPINIGSGEEISMSDLANEIKKVVGFEGNIIWDTSKPNGQPRRCLDTSNAKKLLNWQSSTPFSQGLKNTFDWFLLNK